MENKWFDTWRARWARMKRVWELAISGLLLTVGVLLSVALLPELPSMVWGTLTGDGGAARTLFICAAGVAVCVLQWRWRTAFYPQLKRDAAAARDKSSS